MTVFLLRGSPPSIPLLPLVYVHGSGRGGGIHWARIHFRFQGLSKAVVRYCFPWIGGEEPGLKIMGEDETEEVKVGRVESRVAWGGGGWLKQLGDRLYGLAGVGE